LKNYFLPLSKINEFWDCVLNLQGKIKLYNVTLTDISNLASEKGKRSPEELKIILNCIQSVEWVFDEGLLLQDLPSAEILRLKFSESEEETQDASHFKINKNAKQLWCENLKAIHVDMASVEEADEECVKTVSNLIFDKRPLVTNLKISSELDVKLEDVQLFFNPSCLCYFNNLKRLSLDCKAFDQGFYIELFSVLAANDTKLEWLAIEVHSDIDDDFFYGNDRNNPILLQMSRKYA